MMKAAMAVLGLALATLVPHQETTKPTKPEIGKPAPSLRLNNHAGKAVTVGPDEAEKTWTVLAFFPKAATPG